MKREKRKRGFKINPSSVEPDSGKQLAGNHSSLESLFSLPDRAKVVRGLPDVATIMEDKVVSDPSPWPAGPPCAPTVLYPSEIMVQSSTMDSRAERAGSPEPAE